MPTKEQCADAFTKFLSGGPDQKRAQEQLAMDDVTAIDTGRLVHDRIRVCRIIVPDTNFGALGQNLNILSSAAISALCRDAKLTWTSPLRDSGETAGAMVKFLCPPCQDVNTLGSNEWSLSRTI